MSDKAAVYGALPGQMIKTNKQTIVHINMHSECGLFMCIENSLGSVDAKGGGQKYKTSKVIVR